jgi:hypothetical protein
MCRATTSLPEPDYQHVGVAARHALDHLAYTNDTRTVADEVAKQLRIALGARHLTGLPVALNFLQDIFELRVTQGQKHPGEHPSLKTLCCLGLAGRSIHEEKRRIGVE